MRRREQDRKRSCAGKMQTFRSKEAADAAALELNIDVADPRSLVRRYQCRFG